MSSAQQQGDDQMQNFKSSSDKRIANTEFHERTFEEIIEAHTPPVRPQPYSKLSDHFFARVGNEFGQLLPVYALGHNDPDVRRLASELFEALFVNRKPNDV